jgi:mono/diheme cytochrome c family protein
MSRSAPLLVPTLIAVLAASAPVLAQDPGAFFEDNCAPCHTIGGGELGGPDLKWVTQRHERQWLIRFVMDPQAMVTSGDPRVVDMLKHWDGAVMPSTADLTPQLADAILRYIEQKSDGAGAAGQDTMPAPAFAEADVLRGRALFTGTAPLTHGAPACITCHAAADEGGIAGGGRLGLDLTQVSVRLRGPRGVANWLEAPPTPMMRALVRRAPLTPDENRALTAFLEDVRARPASPAATQVARLAGAGAAGALLGLAAIGLIWHGRFRGVRRPLVVSSIPSLRRGGHS